MIILLGNYKSFGTVLHRLLNLTIGNKIISQKKNKMKQKIIKVWANSILMITSTNLQNPGRLHFIDMTDVSSEF